MEILITYYTQSGNTKFIAEKIHETVSKQYTASIKPLKEVDVETLKEIDLIFIGAPCHDASLAKPAIKFLESLPENLPAKIAGFYTHATYLKDGTERHDKLFDRWAGKCSPLFEKIAKDKNLQFLGDFHCQAKATPPLEDFIHKEIIPNEDEWNTYVEDLRTHPNEDDVKDAQHFAEVLLNLI